MVGGRHAVNWHHLNTLVWLRHRLTINHLRRQGALNFVILCIASGVALVGSVTGFFVAFVAGMSFLHEASPLVLMYLCDGWLLAFLFFWMIGVMTDLQRGEMLSLDKLLHLPTTLTEVFVFNFLSSLVSLTTLTFVPPMLGLCIAAVLIKGAAALVMFPLLAAFVLMVSAVTYQFRGWLATLMSNKRRQRTVMVVLTSLFVLAMQAPQLINIAVQRQLHRSRAESRTKRDELAAKLKTREITPEQFGREVREERLAREQAISVQLNRVVETANLVLPIGWLAHGAKASSTGNPWPGLAGTVGMASIAAYTLRRSYRTTLRYFTGNLTGNQPRKVAAPVSVAASPDPSGTQVNCIEWSFPFVTEPVAAIACATFGSLKRAPEVKLILLGPLIMLIIFGAMLLPNLGANRMPGITRSLMPLGILGLSISGLAQLSQNLFALDRSGFRAYVLSGVPRQQILIGKNLAFAPLVLVPSLVLLTLVQFVAPVPASGFAAALVAIPTAYLLMCLLGNFSSILYPVCQAAGSLKPANASGITMLLQFAFLLTTITIIGVVSIIPLTLEWLVQSRGWLPTIVPTALIAAIVELTASILLYRTIVRQQGDLLQSRECRILDVVVEKGE
jgi:ABC-2 type transport system permease protein